MELNFYQSHIRKYVNENIYQKPTFEIELLGKKYFGTVKRKSKFGVTLSWYQVMGITLGQALLNNIQLPKELKNIKDSFNKSYGDIFFQFGFVDVIEKFDVKALDTKGVEETVAKVRTEKEKFIKQTYGLLPSFRENMPLATVTFDLTQSDENLRKSISKSARNHINKAKSRGLFFEPIQEQGDWDSFYEIWSQTANVKGFHIISKKTFDSLKNFIQVNKCGNLFLAKKDGKIVSGSLCFFHNGNIVYMYGATNREFGNVGGHQFLKYEMFKWGGQNGFTSADLLGVSPTGFKGHHLDGVTSFKQSLGGTKVEYLGNYDLVFNKLLYKAFEISRMG